MIVGFWSASLNCCPTEQRLVLLVFAFSYKISGKINYLKTEHIRGNANEINKISQTKPFETDTNYSQKELL